MHLMGALSLDHWENEPRVQRLPYSLRPDASKNRVKFGKVRSSLTRLPEGSHIHRKRIQRVMQLSTAGRLHVAQGTQQGPVARPADMNRYKESRLMQDKSDVASMSSEDLAETRMAVRQRALWERMMRIAPESLLEAYHDEQEKKAEDFAATYDENAIVRTVTDDPANEPEYLRHWWTYVDDSND
jgi:hypothetical protein